MPACRQAVLLPVPQPSTSLSHAGLSTCSVAAPILCVCVIRMLLGVLRFVRVRSMHGESARACTLCRTMCVPASPCITSVTSFSRGGEQWQASDLPQHNTHAPLLSQQHRRQGCNGDEACVHGRPQLNGRTQAMTQRDPLHCVAKPLGNSPSVAKHCLTPETGDTTLPTVCHAAWDSM